MLKDQELVRWGKLLSLILRHQPELFGLELEEGGWVHVDELLRKIHLHGKALTLPELADIVDRNSKKRYEFNPDQSKIRATQGHSKRVDLNLPEATPPQTLYHGTSLQSWESIQASGLSRMRRNHVHLTADYALASASASRHRAGIVLTVSAAAMHREGFQFYKTSNGVWLVDTVPARFIQAF